jgi:murein DD-endopeptidase MepM/ murein hydrolase activator NlpD
MPRGTRRGVLVAILFILLPTTAAMAGVLEERLQDTRDKAKATKGEITKLDRRQLTISRQVTILTRKVQIVEGPLRDLERQVEQLEYRIKRREARITELKAERKQQEREIRQLNDELDDARELLATRVVAAYKQGDTAIIEQLAGAGSIEELFRREDALAKVVGLDDRVIDRISNAERKVRIKRAQNFELRRQIREDINDLERDRQTVDAQRARAQHKRDEVAGLRAERQKLLNALEDREDALGHRLEDLQEDAKVLKDVIENGTSTYSGAIGGLSSSGLIWPVNGPVVSPFAWRWGRMHEGIDIAISAGNPIHAAASGVVTYAGWMSGYGNMVIVQHAGSLSTGYAHQSQIAVSVGQLVAQGQVIGFVGCTGHCFGDHLHFETRVNGNPQDPMGYL